jgi:site-specific recombinase XerD
VLDRYIEFVAARARVNTVLATASDLRVFFGVVDKQPDAVTTADVLEFMTSQRAPRGDGRVVRLADGEAGLSARTIKRRLSSVSGLFGYLVMLGEMSANPVPRGLATRRPQRAGRGTPMVRTPRTLPKVLEPAEVDVLLAAMRRWRDRAMVEAMVLGGLRRCEVLGLRFEDLRPGEGRVFIEEGKGGHQRLIPISTRSSALWPPISIGSGPTTPTPSASSWCSRDPAGAGRCTRTGSTRSSPLPGPGAGWPMPPAMSCATPA